MIERNKRRRKLESVEGRIHGGFHSQTERVSKREHSGARGEYLVPRFRVWYRPSTYRSCRVGISVRCYRQQSIPHSVYSFLANLRKRFAVKVRRDSRVLHLGSRKGSGVNM